MTGRLVARRRAGHLSTVSTVATPCFDPGYQPRVAVLIPAYNEEKVIERTVRSVLEFGLPEPARDRDR